MAAAEKLENTETRENSAASSGPLGPDVRILREEGGDSTAATAFAWFPAQIPQRWLCNLRQVA